MRPVRTISRKDLGEEVRSVQGPVWTSQESSETIRQTPVGTSGKIWSDLYGDMQRPAEMTGPA